jgi:hypothetical protein
MNRIKLSHAFRLKNKEIENQALAYLSSNGLVSLKDRLYCYGARNPDTQDRVSYAQLHKKEVLIN